MIVGAVDIGTNSMRLLVTDGRREFVRDVVVTGLGYGVDATGRFDPNRVEETLAVLSRYGEIMDGYRVDRRRAVATSATRDASDGARFVERATAVLGVEPEVITGTEEASLSFLGAVGERSTDGPAVVVDIGGGSTEFVYGTRSVVEYAASIDLGSARLTERVVPGRPASEEEMAAARETVAAAFSGIELPGPPAVVVGVAGTFTSLAAIALDLTSYDRDRVDGSVLTAATIRMQISDLSRRTIEETEAIPSLDPRRAPVILAGALVAEGALEAIAADHIEVSEHDLLDGVARSLLRTA